MKAYAAGSYGIWVVDSRDWERLPKCVEEYAHCIRSFEPDGDLIPF